MIQRVGLQQDGSPGVESFGDAFGVIQRLQFCGGDGVEFAFDFESIGPVDESGVVSEIEEAIERLGAGWAEELGVLEEVVEGVAAFEGAVDEDQVRRHALVPEEAPVLGSSGVTVVWGRRVVNGAVCVVIL